MLPVVRSSDPDYVFSLHPSIDIPQAAHSHEMFEFPADAEIFVGFWGIVGRRERRLQSLGPIFLVPKRSAKISAVSNAQLRGEMIAI